jgi:hypothetical protein
MLHVSERCPRCGATFICNAGSIGQCQCAAVRLTDAERAFVATQFDGCLCAACLLALKAEHEQMQMQNVEHISMDSFSAMAWLKAVLSPLLFFLLVLPTHGQQRGFYGVGVDTLISFRKGTGQNFGQEPQYFPRNVFGLPDTTAREDVPSANPFQICSLGFGGEIILSWKNMVLVNRPGPDFTVFENSFRKFDGKFFAEPAKVAASQDGVRFVEFPFDSLSLKGCVGVMPTRGNESPFDPTKSGGDSFDLSAVGLDSVRFIRITDISAMVLNTPNHPFYDPTISGFDLDAIVGLSLAPLSRVTTSVQAASASNSMARMSSTPENITALSITALGDGVFMLSNAVCESSCTVFSILGVEVFHTTYRTTTQDTQPLLSLRHLPHGAYFLVFTTKTNLYVEKVFL